MARPISYAPRGMSRSATEPAPAVVLGGGIAGLAAARLLTRHYPRVVVLERDHRPRASSPEEAFDCWERPGVPQFRHSHAFLARTRLILLAHLPDVVDRLRAGGSRVPWARIHPTWVKHALEDCPRPWLPWAVDTLPAKLRVLVQQAASGEARVIGSAPPAWWGAWMERRAHRRLGVPPTLPAERGANAADDAFEELLHGRSVPLRAVLTTLGVVGFVSHLRTLPRPEQQKLVWDLPTELQSVAARLIERKRWVEDPFWTTAFTEVGSGFQKPLDRMLHLGIADVVRAGVQSGRRGDLRSLALRLPRGLGAWLLEQVAAAPEWTTMPVQPSFDEWNGKLLDLVRGASPEADEGGGEADEGAA